MRTRSFRIALYTVLVHLLGAGALPAQLRQYIYPGTLSDQPKASWDQARTGAEQAKWSLGELRLDPRLGIRDLAYVNNVLNSSDEDEDSRVSDVRGTVEAALHGYVDLGEKSLLTLFARPSYTWWDKQDHLRQSRLTYGTALFGLFNRVSSELSARHIEEERFLNNELRVPVGIETDRLLGAIDVDFQGPFSLFARIEGRDIRYPDEGSVDFDRAELERDELFARFGVEYTLGNGLGIGLGVGLVETDFLVDPFGRSNEGVGPLLRLSSSAGRLQIDLQASVQTIEFDGPDLQDSDELSGAARFRWSFTTLTDGSLYGARNLVYSALDSRAYFLSEVVGFAVGWQLEPLTRVSVFVETGTDDYDSAGSASDRVDDLQHYGVRASFEIGRFLVLSGGVTETQIDSNLSEFDRSFTTVSATLALARGLAEW